MKKIGLALGGGAVLGAAHIGVLRALEERDVEISFITGTSIGVLLSGLCMHLETHRKTLKKSR